jgi:hypothetical protein
MNTYYKVMPIDVLPEESGWYLCHDEDYGSGLASGLDFTLFYFRINDGWYSSELGKYKMNFKEISPKNPYWLKPITLTLQELLSTEEGKEIIREIFGEARSITPDGPFLSSGFVSYPTPDDFIKTNTHDSSK